MVRQWRRGARNTRTSFHELFLFCSLLTHKSLPACLTPRKGRSKCQSSPVSCSTPPSMASTVRWSANCGCSITLSLPLSFSLIYAECNTLSWTCICARQRLPVNATVAKAARMGRAKEAPECSNSSSPAFCLSFFISRCCCCFAQPTSIFSPE